MRSTTSSEIIGKHFSAHADSQADYKHGFGSPWFKTVWCLQWDHDFYKYKKLGKIWNLLQGVLTLMVEYISQSAHTRKDINRFQRACASASVAELISLSKYICVRTAVQEEEDIAFSRFFSASAGIKVKMYRLLPEERKAYFLESVNAGMLGPLRKEAAQ